MTADTLHELTVAADTFVVVLSCSCGWRTECDDDEVPLADLVRIAEDHRFSAHQLEDVLGHLAGGHATRMTRSPDGARLELVCSCGQVWPVEVS